MGSGLSLCRMDLKFSAHIYFMMRNSNMNSVSTENQHENLMKFAKCPLHSVVESFIEIMI